MSSIISWYVLITILGWLTFPLAYRIFPALADRGYTLSRALGLLIWGYVFWLFAMFGIAQNDIGGLLLGLVVLGGLSAWAFINRQSEIQNWLKDNKSLIITTEILFLVTFGFMAFIRSANPEIVGTEKPMELMFINGIMNSPTFPPRDLWLSGYSISYYYFGYVMTAMLATFTGVPATMAFNLMLALIFSLSAVGAYGVLYNLLANYQLSRSIPVGPITEDQSQASDPSTSSGQRLQSPTPNPISSIFSPLLAPLFLLIFSNVEGFLEILHKRGLFWSGDKNFWTWLDMKELSEPPVPLAGNIFERLGYWWGQGTISEVPLPEVNSWLTQIIYWLDLKSTLLGKWFSEQFMPDRYWWWWRASRVIQDYDLNGTPREAIDEFPAFSYILGDLHPHVLSMPFVLLAIAVALNIFLGGWNGSINLYFGQLRINKLGFFVSALVLGGLAFLNTWDVLFVGVLIVFSYALAQVNEAGWGWERVEDVLLFGIPLAVTAFVMYLPFYIGFDSQAGGVVPNFMYPTRGAQLWVMWGTLFVPLFAYLIHLWRSKTPANWRAGILTALGIVLTLLAAMFVIGFMAVKFQPDIVDYLLNEQALDANAFVANSMSRRLSYIGSLITLLALLIPTLSFLLSTGANDDESSNIPHSTFRIPHFSFILLLIALATLLILGIDFVYLRDGFGYRINSVFKFYYQAWILLSLAAAYGTVLLLKNLRGLANGIFSVIFAIVLIVGLAYPVMGFPEKTNNFKPPFGYTLDDFDRVQRENPDEAAAMMWLRAAPDGVVAESIGGSYSGYGRISIYTGLPTVLGWPGHESQWRDGALQGSRDSDIETLYTTPDWVPSQEIIDRYNIRYIVVGNLERSTYRVNEEKFNRFLKPVFQQGNVTVYEVP
jgi:YYY domain-containing protein